MEISDAGLALIEKFEGFESAPYRDAVGVWTIGYGTTYNVGPDTPPITQERATELLKEQVASEYGAAVNALGLPLNQHQFDACCSFVYNEGPGVLDSSSTFGSYLRERSWTAAANSMLGYDIAGGQVLSDLVTRRELERALFLSPMPPPPDPLAPLTSIERQMVKNYQFDSRHRHLHARELANLRDRIAFARVAIYRAAVDGQVDGKQVEKGWHVHNRLARYHILSAIAPPPK